MKNSFTRVQRINSQSSQTVLKTTDYKFSTSSQQKIIWLILETITKLANYFDLEIHEDHLRPPIDSAQSRRDYMWDKK
jgi:hypothetical protein